MTASRQVAVIGSGFGGLSQAIRLQTAGFDVTVIEGRDKPGRRRQVDVGAVFPCRTRNLADPDERCRIMKGGMAETEGFEPSIPFWGMPL